MVHQRSSETWRDGCRPVETVAIRVEHSATPNRFSPGNLAWHLPGQCALVSGPRKPCDGGDCRPRVGNRRPHRRDLRSNSHTAGDLGGTPRPRNNLAALEVAQRHADAAVRSGDFGAIHLADRIQGLSGHLLRWHPAGARDVTERALRQPHLVDPASSIGCFERVLRLRVGNEEEAPILNRQAGLLPDDNPAWAKSLAVAKVTNLDHDNVTSLQLAIECEAECRPVA
jgi:hypothetical protein